MSEKISECLHRIVRWTLNNVCSTQRTIDPSSNQRDSCRMADAGSVLTSEWLAIAGEWDNLLNAQHLDVKNFVVRTLSNRMMEDEQKWSWSGPCIFSASF